MNSAELCDLAAKNVLLQEVKSASQSSQNDHQVEVVTTVCQSNFIQSSVGCKNSLYSKHKGPPGLETSQNKNNQNNS